MDLSVIISACNMQGYIAACLRSVTRCSRENIAMECIVVDDGSTEDTADVVHRYMERDSRIRLFKKESGGISAVRNRGLEEAVGRYILFLDADDRLCEDAWEQIEAAVEEDYADFVAFSHILLQANGKLKAQMLPLSDVVSTDTEEAQRLMYADSVLNTCWGKLFKGSIIRDNHIFFRTDLPVGQDFLFVAECFACSSSYMLSKAMIVYYLQRRGSVIQEYDVESRLAFMKAAYDYSAAAVTRYNDGGLAGRMKAYYVRELSNLFCEYARAYRTDKERLAKVFDAALENETVNQILDGVDEHMISPGRERFEYRLLKDKKAGRIRKYFSLRALL